jgi:hypothetical protein
MNERGSEVQTLPRMPRVRYEDECEAARTDSARRRFPKAESALDYFANSSKRRARADMHARMHGNSIVDLAEKRSCVCHGVDIGASAKA